MLFPRLLRKQIKAADTGISGSQGHCNSKDPFAPHCSSCLLFRKGWQKAKDLNCKHIPNTSLRRPSFLEVVEGAGDGKGEGREAREVPILFVIGSGHWVSGVGRVPLSPRSAALLQPEKSLQRFNEAGGRERKMRGSFRFSLKTWQRPFQAVRKEKKKKAQ